jgi:hypothetical protein
MLLGGFGDHGGYNSSHNQQCHASLGTLLACLNSYNNAVAVIDGQIQSIKVSLVAMLFV